MTFNLIIFLRWLVDKRKYEEDDEKIFDNFSSQYLTLIEITTSYYHKDDFTTLDFIIMKTNDPMSERVDRPVTINKLLIPTFDM